VVDNLRPGIPPVQNEVVAICSAAHGNITTSPIHTFLLSNASAPSPGGDLIGAFLPNVP
jgi:hypothetical protein